MHLRLSAQKERPTKPVSHHLIPTRTACITIILFYSYLRRLQEAAAAAANQQNDGSPDMDISAASPISTLASSPQAMVSPSIGSKSPPSFLETPINSLPSIPSVPIPPSRY